MTIEQLNAADRGAFVAAVGFAFEHSPWIAETAWDRRPFAGVDAMHAAMLAVLDAAPDDRKVALIVAHPDLAGRIAREGRLTAASTDEQASAGLDKLSAEQLARFDALNGAYRERFAFPFVISAREHDTVSILAALQARAGNDRSTEIAAALREIGKIAHLRLIDAVEVQ
ncbi:MAG: 2-oxo-4-hydroxy-4-carboxy-5-ureidoimidazoline decarboxylase [Candidatus Eremiobacteraeota bacterium]|nr:2-oxo-4-hydroxy-4-carboxy-5-ureidoimidazoline decarboxylase [Candidatus Eremiobacteraeota bacterium]